MDPLTTLGVGSNILQFLELGAKILSTSVQFYQSSHGALAENFDIERTTKDLVHHSQRLGTDASRIQNAALAQLCLSCNATAEELLATLDKLKLNGRSNKIDSIAKAAKSLWSKRDIEGLQRRLMEYRAQLMLHVAIDNKDNISSLRHQQLDAFASVEKKANDIVQTVLAQGHTMQAANMIQQAQMQAICDAVVKLNDEQQLTRRTMFDSMNRPALDSLPMESSAAWTTIRDAIAHFIEARGTDIHNQTVRTAVSREVLQAWVKPVFTKDRWMSSQKSRVPKTCEWIFGKPEYQEWLSPSRVGNSFMKILWIHGGPGFGKTTLCASIVQQLKVSHPLRVCYFFCTSNDELKREPESILRSWIAQLVEENDEAFDVARNLYTSSGGSHGQILVGQELWQLFKQLCSTVPDCFYIMDGFDECVKSAAGAGLFLNKSDQFLDQLVDICIDTPGHILLVSREDPGVRSQLRRFARLCPGAFFEYRLAQDDTKDDVLLVTSHVFDRRLSRKNAKLKEELAKNASDRSQGMFLWVQLLASRLSQDRPSRDLRKTVSETPVHVNNLYENTLAQICELGDERDRAIAILRWVLYAQRPLTVRELAEILAIELDDDCDMYPKDNLPDSWEEEEENDRIRRLCGPLVELRADQEEKSSHLQTVHFVHFSVQEYLLNVADMQKPTFQSLSFSSNDAEHELLSSMCLHYMSYRDISSSAVYTADEIRSKLIEFSFLRYAASFWFVHAHKVAQQSPELNDQVVNFFDSSPQALELWARVYESSHLTSDPELTACAEPQAVGSPVYYAAELGFEQPIRALIAQRFDVDGEGPGYGTALSAAVARKHIQVVRLLLEAGADVNKVDQQGTAPLHWAAYGDNVELVQLILDHHGVIDSRQSEGRTPLMLAAMCGQTDVMRLFIQQGANVNEKDAKGWTVAQLAIYANELCSLRVLLDHCADLALQGAEGTTMLHAAAMTGSLPTVKLLLDHRADLEATDEYSYTPLWYAARDGHDAIFEHLLENGAELQCFPTGGGFPLHIAARKGHLRVVQIALKFGADVDLADHEGCTPLMHAAMSGQVESVEYLLRQSASLDAVVTPGIEVTALHMAVAQNQLKVVKSLLDAGAASESKSLVGHTLGLAVCIASQTPSHIAMLKLLLQYRTSIEAPRNDEIQPGPIDISRYWFLECPMPPDLVDEDGQPAILYALRKGNMEAVEILFSLWADLTFRRYDGFTILHSTVQAEQVESLRWVLRHAIVEQRSVDVYSNTDTQAYMHQRHCRNFKTPDDQEFACSQTHDQSHATSTPSHVTKLDINAQDYHQRTALHLAFRARTADMARFLIEAGVDTSLPDVFGFVPSSSLKVNIERSICTVEPVRRIATAYYAGRSDFIRSFICVTVGNMTGPAMIVENAHKFYNLGTCLKMLGDVTNARCSLEHLAIFAPGCVPDCDSCGAVNLDGHYFVCTTCYRMDLCEACMIEYEANTPFWFCQEHEFFEVGSSTNVTIQKEEDKSKHNEDVKSWLRQLREMYSDTP